MTRTSAFFIKFFTNLKEINLKGIAARLLCLVLFLSVFVSAAFAGVQEDVGRIFELNAKLQPGMHLDLLNELLGPPAGMHQMGGGAQAFIRYMWLHGEMGIEVYCMQNIAHKVSITLPFQSERDVPRAMDALTRRGQSQYGSMPRFDHVTGEYYWIGNGVRFGYSKYNSRTVRSSCTRSQ